ncbi:hypothetical protein CL617_04115 [archaeon]|jgi:hypothetical protein|nr:hypothetical protein [archaeon]|tara:strand:- start:18156 stop:18353 length:198 start_codon:yes stop_codon:yes gene_type:complete
MKNYGNLELDELGKSPEDYLVKKPEELELDKEKIAKLRELYKIHKKPKGKEVEILQTINLDSLVA